jgi:hypothetical protein
VEQVRPEVCPFCLVIFGEVSFPELGKIALRKLASNNRFSVSACVYGVMVCFPLFTAMAEWLLVWGELMDSRRGGVEFPHPARLGQSMEWGFELGLCAVEAQKVDLCEISDVTVCGAVCHAISSADVFANGGGH